MLRKNLNIVFLGPPASGKGTQGKMLAQKIGLAYISTGKIFRENIKKKTKLGKMASSLINKGKLVPDSITNQLVQKILKKVRQGFVLDGYPRDIKQAKALEKMINIDSVFYIKISDKEAIQRIVGRRVCPNCGQVYHIKINPPKKRGICDVCGSKLIHREDDKREVVKKRLKIYHQDTEPVVNFYKNNGILVEINGEQSIEKVHRDIVDKIKNTY